MNEGKKAGAGILIAILVGVVIIGAAGALFLTGTIQKWLNLDTIGGIVKDHRAPTVEEFENYCSSHDMVFSERGTSSIPSSERDAYSGVYDCADSNSEIELELTLLTLKGHFRELDALSDMVEQFDELGTGESEASEWQSLENSYDYIKSVARYSLDFDGRVPTFYQYVMLYKNAMLGISSKSIDPAEDAILELGLPVGNRANDLGEILDKTGGLDAEQYDMLVPSDKRS